MAQTPIKELQVTFQTPDVSICNCNMKYPIETSTFHIYFAFQLFHVSIAIDNVEVKNTISNSLISMFTTSWRNLIKIGWSELYKILSFVFVLFFVFVFVFVLLQKAVSHVNHSDISLAPFWKRFLQVKQFHDTKGFNTRLLSFVILKIMVVWHMKPE